MSRALTTALTKLKKTYPSAVREIADASIERYFLGSPQLNYLFGGGYPTDRIVQLHGPESSGKSTLSTYIGGEIQKREEHNIVVYVDFERTFDATYAENLGLDTTLYQDGGKFIFLRPENGEEAFTILEELVRSGEIGLVIWDSDTTTPSRAQQADEYGKASFGGSAKVFSEGLRKFNPILDKYGTSLIMISQERDNVGALYGPDYKVTGGRAIKFYATNRSRITRTGYIKEKGETIGIDMKIRNGKNKAGIPFRQAELSLMFNGGFDVNKEYMDFIVMLKIVDQAGAYFKSEKYGFSLQGRAKLQEWLDAHPKEYADIKLQVNQALCGETELDANNVAPDEEEVPVRAPKVEEAKFVEEGKVEKKTKPKVEGNESDKTDVTDEVTDVAENTEEIPEIK